MIKKLCADLHFHLKNDDTPVNLSGLNQTSAAFIISHFISEYPEEFGILLICPDKDISDSFSRNLRTFLKTSKNKSQTLSCEQFNGWDASPYSGLTPSIKNRIGRLRTLYRVSSGTASIIVTDIVSSLQRCLTLTDILTRSAVIKSGDFIARHDLIESLERAGYFRTDPCEDVGTFSIRGSIVDIFSSAYSKPIRIDFFGDEVERIRHYDPLTQRSGHDLLHKAILIPCKEWPESNLSVNLARSKIKHHCDELGIGKKQRDAFLESLEAQGFGAHYDFYFPFFIPENAQSNLFSELKRSENKKWRTLVYDPLNIDSHFDRFHQSLVKEYNNVIKDGLVVPIPESVYISDKDFLFQLKQTSAFIFNPIDLGLNNDSRYIRTLDPAETSLDVNLDAIENLQKEGTAIAVYSSTASQLERLEFLLESRRFQTKRSDDFDPNELKKVQLLEGTLYSGFKSPDLKIAIFADSELVGEKKQKSIRQKKQEAPFDGLGTFVSSLEDLEENDLVVHLKHGVGKYRGIIKLELEKVPQDFLLIEYADNDKLYLPIYRLDQIQRYIAGDGQGVFRLDKLGSAQFEKTKEKVRGELRDVAQKLLELYAKRATRTGVHYNTTDDFTSFEARFPFPETPDQLKAIEDTLRDMQSDRIMDRLICGDVGYGKTEIAMRAAFVAVSNSKQVALLVPTTVLALQHERSFRERFRDTAIRIDAVSRFKSTAQIKESLDRVREGKSDIIIGTHRLLSKDVSFHDLGLLIVDEEQRFGVEHKEKLKELKINSDVLTLTATPIPRTLQLSLMGLRDISVINTAPIDRLAVRTYVARYDENLIRSAINQELSRGGQVFFLHNRVQTIDQMADKIKSLVPKARVVVGHGQLSEGELEKRMVDFYNRKYDVLICSTIIESGLDIPTANTMLINRADMFGLSQLYQLRGRVGRSQVRAYCYLLLPEAGQVTADARKRLEIIQKFAELGSGFRVASHDLELRGGGDIIGNQQAGHISSVGYEMFMDLLGETIQQLRGETVDDHFDPEIKIPVPALIPEEYVPDVHQRLSLYRKLSTSNTPDETHAVEIELQERYGKPAQEVLNLLWLIRIKQILRKHFIKNLTAGKDRVSLEASEQTNVSTEKILRLVASESDRYQLSRDSKIVISYNFETTQGLFHEVEKLFSKVAEG